MTDAIDDPPTEEEKAQASALAAALEPAARVDPGLPVDAWEAAAWLRTGTHARELEPARVEAIREWFERSSPRPGRHRRILLATGGGLSAAAAAVLVMVTSARSMAPPHPRLPRPSLDLVKAQLEAIRHPGPPDPQLEHEMQQYRETLYAELERRHGGGR